MGSDFWTPDGHAWPGTNDVIIFPDGNYWIALSFAVRVATWLDSSDIVFVNSATEVLSACVAVARFARARVWYCCILAKRAPLDCVACTFAEYPLVFEVLDDILVSLNA